MEIWMIGVELSNPLNMLKMILGGLELAACLYPMGDIYQAQGDEGITVF